jgi:hypothetical protein
MMTRRWFLTSLAAAGASTMVRAHWEDQGRQSPASQGPADILLLRHAEEPDHGPDLSARGNERARAIPRLFPSRFPKPTAILATRTSKESARPMDTMAPLAKALGLTVDDRFSDEHYLELAEAVLHEKAFAGGHVVICWHHGTLPELAHALGVDQPLTWPSSRYDRLWIIRYTNGHARLSDESQRLLPGDDLRLIS